MIELETFMVFGTRKRSTPRFGEFFAALAVVASCTGALHGQTTMTALNRAETAYRGMQTLRAEFSQTLEYPMMGDPVVSRGTIFLAPPSRFSMRLLECLGPSWHSLADYLPAPLSRVCLVVCASGQWALMNSSLMVLA